MTAAVRVRGLYAVTPDTTDTIGLAEWVEAALAGGAALVQYRNKTADPSLRTAQARALQSICKARAVPLIINDYPDLVATVGADGLHVGQRHTRYAAHPYSFRQIADFTVMIF